MLPIVFLSAASLMLVLALFAFWQSVRALFGRGVDEVAAAVGGDRAALLDEKNALLRALKDLEFERGVGKVSEADFARLEASYRARAKAVLAGLDRDLGPWRERAEALARARVPAAPDAPSAATPAETPAAPVDDAAHTPSVSPAAEAANASRDTAAAAVASPDVDARVTCAKCGAQNDADAVYCKKCAARLGDAPAEGRAEGDA
jgi:ribosomal protein L40E